MHFVVLWCSQSWGEERLEKQEPYIQTGLLVSVLFPPCFSVMASEIWREKGRKTVVDHLPLKGVWDSRGKLKHNESNIIYWSCLWHCFLTLSMSGLFPCLKVGNMVPIFNIQQVVIECCFSLSIIFSSEIEVDSLPDCFDNVGTDQCLYQATGGQSRVMLLPKQRDGLILLAYNFNHHWL